MPAPHATDSAVEFEFATQFFTGRMPFLPSNQQRKSTEGQTETAKYIQ